MYSDKDNTVYVARGVEGNELFFALSRELARAQSGQETFICDCAANIACLRYGVPAKYCDRIPDEIASLETREKRSALNIVREAACEIALLHKLVSLIVQGIDDKPMLILVHLYHALLVHVRHLTGSLRLC